MTENITYDRGTVWNELVNRARESGIADQEAFNELVDDYFMEEIEVGEMDNQENTEELADEMKGRWEDAKMELGI